VPANVANAIYGLSDKYPIMVDLAVSYNTTGVSPADPQYPTGLQSQTKSNAIIHALNPIQNKLELNFSNDLLQQNLHLYCYNMLGQLILNTNIAIQDENMSIPFPYAPGIYFIKIANDDQIISNVKIIKY
jgi:hypothetical protein